MNRPPGAPGFPDLGSSHRVISSRPLRAFSTASPTPLQLEVACQACRRVTRPCFLNPLMTRDGKRQLPASSEQTPPHGPKFTRTRFPRAFAARIGPDNTELRWFRVTFAFMTHHWKLPVLDSKCLERHAVWQSSHGSPVTGAHGWFVRRLNAAHRWARLGALRIGRSCG